MVLKQRDSLDATLARLEQTLSGNLSAFERRNLEKQVAQIRSGINGEDQAAYHIDFFLKDHRNWVVIHDLRLEWNGRVAQIDHLILSRCLDVYVVESKNFRTKVRYANGGWERLVFGHWEGIPCPVEQNERHIFVLKQLITECGLAPTRLGLPMPVDFFNMVIVAPSCSVVGKFPGNARVHRMDKLMEEIDKTVGAPLSLLKIISPETLLEFGEKLAAYHKPVKANVIAPVKMEIARKQPLTADRQHLDNCENCGGAMTRAEKYFCRMQKDHFAGKQLCQPCQKFVPALATSVSPSAQCEECGAGVDAKVATYCERNTRKFGRRILCRKCQSTVKMAAA